MESLDKKGWSLVEVLVTTVIFTAVVGVLYTTLNTGNRAWQSFEMNVSMQREARAGLQSMVPELREAKDLSLDQDSQHSIIHFTTAAKGNVTYSWTVTGPDANKIIRQNQETTRTLAKDISALTFTNLGNAIIVDITSEKIPAKGKASHFRLKEKVSYR